MTRRHFGTDGVRGTVRQSPMTPDFVLRLGYAAGRFSLKKAPTRGADREGHAHLGLHGRVGARGRVFGRRRRRAYVRADADARVAYHARAAPRGRRGDQRVAQPYPDNGIKFFSADGFKLPDDTEARIEGEMERPMAATRRRSSGRLARRRRARALHRVLQVHVSLAARPERSQDRRRLRARRHVPRRAARIPRLGADVVPIGVDPGGFNINRGVGATSPDSLKKHVTTGKRISALRSTARRVLMVDASGRSYDGTSFSSPSPSTVPASKRWRAWRER